MWAWRKNAEFTLNNSHHWPLCMNDDTCFGYDLQLLPYFLMHSSWRATRESSKLSFDIICAFSSQPLLASLPSISWFNLAIRSGIVSAVVIVASREKLSCLCISGNLHPPARHFTGTSSVHCELITTQQALHDIPFWCKTSKHAFKHRQKYIEIISTHLSVLSRLQEIIHSVIYSCLSYFSFWPSSHSFFEKPKNTAHWRKSRNYGDASLLRENR